MLFSLLSSIGFLVSKAYAQDASFFSCRDLAPASGECHPIMRLYSEPFGACGSGIAFIVELACRGLMLIMMCIGVFCTMMIIFGAGEIITSGLASENKEKGKKIIQTALLGIMWAIIGGALVRFLSGVIVGMVDGI